MPFIDGGGKEKGELTGCGVLCQVACRRLKKEIGSRRKSSFGIPFVHPVTRGGKGGKGG